MAVEVHRSRAPLRLGLGGGGSDLASYYERYEGTVLNATINMYAYATIEPLDNGKVQFVAADGHGLEQHSIAEHLPEQAGLALHRGVYNRIVRDFAKRPLPLRMTTYVDAPPGSGLGSSSTLVVAMVGAYVEWLNLPLGEYEIASLAYDIERVQLGLSGGKQDQYAATFGGVNYMEFRRDGSVIVNPLRIKSHILDELSLTLILVRTSTSRVSSAIIDTQIESIRDDSDTNARLQALHGLKDSARLMKDALLTGSLSRVGELLHQSWELKKSTSPSVSTPEIDGIYATAMNAGATGGKISGAGGGGFAMFYCPGNRRYPVMDSLARFHHEFRRYQFTTEGLRTWTAPRDQRAREGRVGFKSDVQT